MNGGRMPSVHKVDLTKLDGGGDFPCPKCGVSISPEDESETIYTVVDIVAGDDGSLESMVIRCNGCNTLVRLEGFDELEEAVSRVEISEASEDSKPGYQTVHSVSLDGESIGQLIVDYAQKEDVKAFKRIRKMRVGNPFKCKIIISSVKRKDISNQDLSEITMLVLKKMKGLREGDVYFLEMKDGRENLIGKATQIMQEEYSIPQQLIK